MKENSESERDSDVVCEENTTSLVQQYCDKYPWSNSVLNGKYMGHIQRVTEPIDCRYVFFDLKKTVFGRTCKFTERVHGENNLYLKMDTIAATLHLECHRPNCNSKTQLLAHGIQCSVGNMDLTDWGIADLFVLSSPTKFLSKLQKERYLLLQLCLLDQRFSSRSFVCTTQFKFQMQSASHCGSGNGAN